MTFLDKFAARRTPLLTCVLCPEGLRPRHRGPRSGYPRLLASHAREHGPAQRHACLAHLAQGTVCKILDQEEVKPHKVRYYLEQRDPDFAEKMAKVLCIYRQVKILKEAAAAAKNKPSKAVAIISYDEKPGIRAIATTRPSPECMPPSHASLNMNATAR